VVSRHSSGEAQYAAHVSGGVHVDAVVRMVVVVKQCTIMKVIVCMNLHGDCR
jgi:hypothetical protein